MAGRGTIDQLEPGAKSKCRKWRIRASTGFDPATGRYGRITKTVHGSYREAQRELALLMTEKPERKSREEIGELVDAWLGSLKVSASTKRLYTACTRAFVDRFGHMRMDRLSREAVQDFIDLYGASHADKSTKTVRNIISAFLRWCERSHRIESAASLIPDIIKCAPTTRNALTDDSVASLIDSCRADVPLHRAVMLALLAGLRRGECCRCVTWEGIDWERGLLHVPGTKTAASNAVVPLTPALLEFLRPAKSTGYIVDMTDDTMAYKWRKMRDEVGLKDVKFHELRHTYITLLARSGVHPAVMQRLARHADPRVTMTVYTHVHMEQETAGVMALGEHLNAAKK